ncbi:MAG: hypothetical protein Q8R18_01795 [bacterium]|nr:hypothetical protein [bacterium]
MVRKRESDVRKAHLVKVIFVALLILLVLSILGVIFQIYVSNQEESLFSSSASEESSSLDDLAVGTVSLTIVDASQGENDA